ncbi:ABC transporter ATP-binding protein [Ornatilinea apprima]|nr:ATP-binding cassette domain-containing protein [Ornatilinea apprima]
MFGKEIKRMIEVQNLTKTYRVPVRQAGLKSALGSLFKPTYEEVPAVRGVSFSVQAGEMVGLIGPNGAGKTTTLKMLAGLLYPSGGSARVADFIPWERKPAYLRRISMVLGNKSQLQWDIPPLDTFRVLGEIYSVPRAEQDQVIDELVELLEMQDLLRKPARNLSLGERMKCELVAGLIHRPQVLFLDEPTLGLDVSMQARLRAFVRRYNQLHGCTVMLTSHYMGDVSALCPRVILIHHGVVLYDGALNGLAQRLSPFKLIQFSLAQTSAEALAAVRLPDGAEWQEGADERQCLRVRREYATETIAALLNALPVADLGVEDPPIEAVIDQIYQEGSL